MTATEVYGDRTQKVAEERCPHCSRGWVYEPTEDTLEDEALACFMCLGTTRKMSREERRAIKDDRDLDAQWSCLERMGS